MSDWAAWARLRDRMIAHHRAQGTPCQICGAPIDYEAPGRSRWAPSIDHIHSVAHGGDLLPPDHLLRVVHFGCNARRGARTRRIT